MNKKTRHHRPLEFYTEELRKSGFVLTSLTEPHPSPDQGEGRQLVVQGLRVMRTAFSVRSHGTVYRLSCTLT